MSENVGDSLVNTKVYSTTKGTLELDAESRSLNAIPCWSPKHSRSTNV